MMSDQPLQKPFNKAAEPKHFIITMTPWNRQVLVCINYTSKQVNDLLTKRFKKAPMPEDFAKHWDEKNINTAMYFYHKSGQFSMVLMKPGNFGHALVSWSHESIHILRDLMEDRGIKLSEETEEAYAYTMEHLMEHFILNM